MTVYAHYNKGVVFTEDTLKRKVEEIIKNCWEKKSSYDDYFDRYISNFSDFLSENDYAEDMLMDVLLNKNVSVIEELEEKFFEWSFEKYFADLTYIEMAKMELFEE